MQAQDSRTMGRIRCMSIINFVVERCSLTREQIQLAVFGKSDYATWKCRSILKKLCREGKLKRGRCMVSNDYVYFTGRPPNDINHLIQINWIWATLFLTDKLDYFQHEVDLGEVWPDAYFVYNSKPYFLEMHRSVNQRKFDKVPKYIEYAKSGKWDTPDWPLPGKFARILIIAETEKEAGRLRGIVERESTSGLNFTVRTLVDFRQNGLEATPTEQPKEVIKWAGF